MKKKKIAILGSTGSIGMTTLEVLKKEKFKFSFELLTANNNYKKLIQQAKQFKAKNGELKKYSKSTIKQKLYAIHNIGNLLNLNLEKIKHKADEYREEVEIKTSIKQPEQLKTVEEGDEIINNCEDKLKELGEQVKAEIKENCKLEYSKLVQNYILLYIYLNYGVIREDELINMKILDYEDKEENHINIKSRQMVIHKHKTNYKGSKYIDLDNKLLIYYQRV